MCKLSVMDKNDASFVQMMLQMAFYSDANTIFFVFFLPFKIHVKL